MRFSRTRRFIAAGAIAAAASLPMAFTSATPASASCGPQAYEDGGNGCSNPCNEGLEKLARKLGQELNCIQ